MTDPVLRATMASGTTWNDPSEDLLFELLTDIEAGDEDFLIVDRTGDPSGNTYAQVIRTHDALYQVEHRDGGPGRHFQAFTPDKRQAHSVLTGWAFELPGWREGLPWTPIDVG
jgi:hypothetical protein